MCSVRLLESLATTEALAGAFSDAALLDGMLRFEAALARAQAQTGLVPASVPDAIAAVPVDAFDAAAIAQAARTSGTIAIAFVQTLVARVQAIAPDAARFVHYGATSQDVTDTAMALCLHRASDIVANDHQRLAAALRALSDRHRDTLMLGRTLMQPAAPITFGLKAANWFGGAMRAYASMDDAFAHARVVQFGGPAGTLAAFGSAGPALGERIASELNLSWSGAPWHTERDRLATLVTSCAVYTGALAKIARDVSLLMQFEVGEAAEPGGGSSSMPHKRNPSACALILAAATRVPALTAAFLSAVPQEHERGLGGWHAEGLTLAEVVQGTGSALAAAAGMMESLEVRPDRMRRNLEATRGMVPGADAADVSDQHLGAAELFRRRLLDQHKG
jgi:3-carboxy-cis,cis-muconate cycloisomerase